MSLETVYLGRAIAKIFEKVIYPWMKKHGPFKIWVIWTAVSLFIWAVCYFGTPGRHGLGGLLLSFANPLYLFFLLLYAIKRSQEKRESRGLDIVEPLPHKKKTIRYTVAGVVVFAEIVLLASYFKSEPMTTLINISSTTRFLVFLISFIVLATPIILALRAYYTPKRPKGFGVYIYIVIMFCLIAGSFNMGLVYTNFVESWNKPTIISESPRIAEVEILEAETRVTYTSSNNVRKYYKNNDIKLRYNFDTYSISVSDDVFATLPNGQTVIHSADAALYSGTTFSKNIFAGKAEMKYVDGRLGYPCVLGFIAADSANTLPPDHEIERMQKQMEETQKKMLELFMKSAPKKDSLADKQQDKK